jgi:hypothetical protein
VLGVSRRAEWYARAGFVEFLRKDELIHTTVGGTDVVVLVPAARGLRLGDRVELAIADNLLHLFDPDNELSLTTGEVVQGSTRP